MKSLHVLVLAATLVLGATAEGRADEIAKFDGGVLKGTIVQSGEEQVSIRLEDGKLVQVAMSNVNTITNAKGEVTECVPKLSKASLPPQAVQLIESLKSAEDDSWGLAAMELGDFRCTGVFEEMKKLAADVKPGIRERAVAVLSMMGTSETLAETLRLALTDKSVGMRKQAVGSLGNQRNVVVLKRMKALDDLKKGLKDADKAVALMFGTVLGMMGDKEGIPALKKGLSDPDHHVRESSAMDLAELGSDAGLSELVKMLTQKESGAMLANRGADAETRNMLKEQMVKEKVAICGLLVGLKAAKAVSALKQAAKDESPEVVEAAKKAIEALEGPRE